MQLTEITTSQRLTRRRWLGGAAALACPWPARAQEQPIRLLVGAPPGSGIDIGARSFGAALGAALDTPAVVVNRPSAGGILAAEAVARAAPDGRTLLYSSLGPLAIAPRLVRSLPYHPVEDFTHIGRLAGAGFALAVPAHSPARDIPGLLALLRQKGDTANYGTNIGGVAYHLAAAMLLQAAGLRATQVSYRSTGEAIAALATGQLDFLVELRPLLQAQGTDGSLRLLAVTSAQPDPGMPNLPMLQQYFPGLVLESWSGLSAPRGLPAAQERQLAAAAKATLQDPAVQALLLRSGATAQWLPGPDFTRFIALEVARMEAVTKAAGIGPG